MTTFKTLSDHNLIDLKLNCDQSSSDVTSENSQSLSGYRKFNFHKADYTKINKDLSLVNWQNKLQNKSVSEQLTCFNEEVLNVASEHTSTKQVNGRTYRSKFYKERRALWRRRNRVQKKNPNQRQTEQLEDIELRIKKSHIAERLHNEHIAIDKITTNSKYFFSYANKTRKGRDKIGPLINKETKDIISDPTKIAEALQSKYCSVFTKPDDSKHIPNINEFFSDNLNGVSGISDINISEEDIITAIKQIKPNSAAGPDGIPIILLKECCEELSKPLAVIYRNSLDTGEIPNILKDALVTPIHKGGLKSDPKNYRPVSLISQLLKILEKVLCVKIVSYLEEHNLMNKNQHGFRKFRSCLSQLIEHYDNVLEAVSKGNNIDVIYLDYSKAFDVVDHHILLRKLKSKGITGKIGIWISNFISNRKQAVVVNQHKSRYETVLSGVPQGSVLGPILFLLMISDIDEKVLNSTLSSFADDTKVSHIINLRQDCDDLQNSLDTICKWSDDNNLNFNELKFQAVRYGDNKETQVFKYKTPSGKYIPDENTVKDLGIMMSKNMKFSDHIDKIASKCRSLSGWILRTFITRETFPMLKLYNSLLLPRIDYCSQLYAPHQNNEWNQLEAIQRRFTNKISEVKDCDYWTRLQKLRLYSLERRAERYKAIYTWKILEKLAPNLSINKIEEKEKLSDRRGRYCVVPKLYHSCSARTNTIRENSFGVQGPRIFNALPREIRNITGVRVETFKYHLDKLLATIPDQPGVPGYAGSRAAATNSIPDQLISGGRIYDANL